MKLHELSPVAGSTFVGKRKGRGVGTGNGKTGGRGHKGQKARSGGKVRAGFEGGQMPLARRIPKRGFNNKFSKKYAVINVGSLNGFEAGSIIDAEALLQAGVIDAVYDGVKVLGGGERTVALTVKAAVFSATAKEQIEAVGGKTEVI